MTSRSFATACALSALLLAAPALAQSGSSDQPASGEPASASETMRVMPPAPERTTDTQAQTGTQPGTQPQGQSGDQQQMQAQQPAPSGDQQQQTEPMQAETETTTEPVEVEVETVEAQPMGSDVELQGGFIARQGQNHIMASELMDAEVRTVGDEDLGSVEDMLVTAEGRILGVVVGVGGFLGIGEKRVAIPSEALQVIFEGEAEATEAAGGTQPPAAQTGQGLAMTGGTEIEYVLVDFTREQLEQAPDFTRLDQQAQAEAEVETETQPVEATGATPPATDGGALPPSGDMIQDGEAPAQPQ